MPDVKNTEERDFRFAPTLLKFNGSEAAAKAKEILGLVMGETTISPMFTDLTSGGYLLTLYLPLVSNPLIRPIAPEPR